MIARLRKRWSHLTSEGRWFAVLVGAVVGVWVAHAFAVMFTASPGVLLGFSWASGMVFLVLLAYLIVVPALVVRDQQSRVADRWLR